MSWLLGVAVDIEDRARRHFTDTELIAGGTILAALLAISIIKKIIFLAVVLIVIAGVVIAYQNGAFDTALDNLQNKPRG